MLLEGRTAVVYGGGGRIGSAVATAFAHHGAHVSVTGRTQAPLEHVVEAIRSAGGSADFAVFDALDEDAVESHMADVVAATGRIDVSLNLITHGDVQGIPLVDISFADFEQPVSTALRSNFLTARAAARRMVDQRSGAILFFGGYGDPLPGYNLGGLQVAFQALETLRRELSAELGPSGVRVLTIQTDGIMETVPDGFEWADQVRAETEARALLSRTATLTDVGNVVVFAASDMAASITATKLNITCGAMVD